MAISFPLIAFAFDLSSVKSRGSREVVRNRWPLYLIYIVLTFFYLALRFYYLKNPQEKLVFHGESAGANILTMVRVAAYYMKLILIPTNLNADYVVVIPYSAFQAQLLLSYAIIGIAIFLTIVSFKNSSGAFLGGAWFLISLGPVSNLVPIKIIMAERYLYLPSGGFVLLLGAAFEALRGAHYAVPHGRALKKVSAVLFALLVFFFSIITFKRNYVWRDEFSLWSATVAVSPISTRAFTNLGIILVDRGNYDEAIKLLRYALRLKPDLAPTMNDLAVAFFKSGRRDKSIAEFKSLLAIKADFADGYLNLGKVFHELGMLGSAATQFKRALEIEPYNPLARNNLGVVMYQRGNLDMALYQYIVATWSDPSNADVHKNLGIVYLGHVRKEKKALYHFRETLRLNPGQAQAKLVADKIEELERK